MSMPWAINVSQIVEPEHILITVETSKEGRMREWILSCGISSLLRFERRIHFPLMNIPITSVW